MIEDNRGIFMFKDGSLAWEAKDYLLEQERCLAGSPQHRLGRCPGPPRADGHPQVELRAEEHPPCPEERGVRS